MIAETDRPEGTGPPKMPTEGADVPDPTAGSGPDRQDLVREAQREPDNPAKAAEDGLA